MDRPVTTDAFTGPIQTIRKAVNALEIAGRPRADLGSAERAYRLLEDREARLEAFPELESESAWALLLALYVARCRGETLKVSQAGTMAGVPDATRTRSLDPWQRPASSADHHTQ